jgi:ribosomal protein L22
MAEDTGYADLTVDQLSTELERRGLPKSGKKADLIARLEGDDAPGASPQSPDPGPQDARADAGEASETADEKPKRGRRRSAETAASAPEDARAAPRDAAGAVAVRAQAKYVRSAPRKARLVMDHIRGKKVADARAILKHTPRAAATDIAKLLDSAVANAENNFELDPDELKIGRAFVDEGPTIKRFRPRAQGRATPIHKRTSHMTITLTTEGKE